MTIAAVTPVRTWKKLLGLDRGPGRLTDAEFEVWIEEMHAALQRERADREERCEDCGASLAHVVGAGEPGQRFEAVVCMHCHPEVLEDCLDGRES